MTTSFFADEKITPFFIVQFCLALIAISAVVLRHGQWNSARVAGLCIAVSAAVLLFTARWQLGKSFSVTPQARELVTWGLYSKIRNPIYVFSALMLLGVLMALQYRYPFLLLLVLVPMQIVRAHQEAKVLESRFGEEYRTYRKRTWF
jgi:protein-S-isoprenylcysteine O-methyltransferase Ste14